VILIIVDALRDDHMGVYGYERDTTPNLSRIAETGRVRTVTGMRTTCGDTICGLLGISTSKVARRFSFRPFSLQEVLRRNGFRTHMILGGDHTNFYSLKRAYGPVDSFVDGNDAQKQGYFMNDDQFLVDQVAALPRWDGVPALFQFHVMSTHLLRKHEDTPGPWQPSATYMLDTGRDTGPGAKKVESATNFYDNGVHRTDKVIGDLLKGFESKGYLENALVVITSDHGESLGEHGLFMHANSLREEALRIPFVLVSFGYEPERALQPRTFASQLDIGPTILAELGIPAPRTWMGHALQEPPVPGIAYLEGRHHVGVIDHRDPQNLWKYWLDVRTGEEHAFNLSRDPKEDHDLIEQIGMARAGEWRLHARSGSPMALASN
jgi:arylsulfatase A-like enzyme